MKPAALKKWIPAVVAPALIATFVVGATLSANAQVRLEPKTPQQLLEMIQGSKVTDFSGNVRATVDIGIPQLPGMDSAAPLSPHGSEAPDASDGSGDGAPGTADLMSMLSMVSGTHEARVYVDGPDKVRLQVMNGMDERDVIRNGSTLWHYDSSSNTVDKATLPSAAELGKLKEHNTKVSDASAVPMTPGELADQFLAAIDPSTTLNVTDSVRIAGRDAYTLELLPRTGDTLVAGVAIGVDAATGAPLSVTVNAVGQGDPALLLAFTSFSTDTPDAARFNFTPPAGATIREHQVPVPPAAGVKDGTHEKSLSHGKNAAPSITGTGWDSVAVIAADQVPRDLLDSALLKQLATPVNGGSLLHTSLLNVLITADGRVVIGSVPEARLAAVAKAE